MKIRTLSIENLYFQQAKPVLESKIKYPELEGNFRQPVEDRFNTYYRADARTRNRAVRTTLLPQAKRDAQTAAQEGYPFNLHSYIRSFEVTRQAEPYLSMYFDTYRYTGGAHGDTVRQGNTWDLRLGLQVPLERFVPRRDFPKLIRAIQGEIAKGDSFWFNDAAQTAARDFDPKRYYLSEEGIVLFYPLYSLAPYSEGIPTFNIPNPHLREQLW